MNVNARLAALFDDRGSRTDVEGGLYSSLAPVYEFMFRCSTESDRHFREQFQIVESAAGAGRDSILEVGCGTGRLISLLEREFATVVAADRYSAMVELASHRTTRARVVEADMREADLGATFDVVVLFEFVASLMRTRDDFRCLARNCLEHLDRDWVFLCDVVHDPAVVIPESTQSFEDDRFQVDRRVTLSKWVDDSVFVQREEFDVREKATGRRETTTAETTIQVFTPLALADQLEEIGFVDVSISSPGDGILAEARAP